MPEPAFSTFHVETDDGLRLHGRDYGQAISDPTPIVCLPGLSRNGRDFHQFALRLQEEGRRAITLDYRGRGLSDWDANKGNYNIVREAQDVVQALDVFGIKRAAFVGTSRGGLILHVLGGMIGERIVAIVFNDIGPVIESDGLRRIRDYLSTKPELVTLSDAANHLRTVHGAEFPALADSDWKDMAEALYRDIAGTLIADFDPALVEPLKSMDFSIPLADLWKQFALLAGSPLLIIRGENSKLLSKETVAEMLARHPSARAVVANGQGHAPVLHVDEVYRSISHFLNAN
jgi:pimeloyl-ACP methyl ester carboxylesterase